MTNILPEQKSEARYKLVQSAKLAKMSGHSQIGWIESEEVSKFILENQLEENLAEHIAAWVWTFRKR